MTPEAHELSLAAEDEGGGLENTEPLNDKTNTRRKSSQVEYEDPEETEDEEVKVNCIGGFAGIQHSDMSSDEDDSDEESDEEDPEDATDAKNEAKEGGPIQFVSSQHVGMDIRRPRAVLANSPSRSLEDVEDHGEDDDDDDSSMDESESSDDDESSVDAQAIGMSLDVTKLEESGDEESLSDASSNGSEDDSSAAGIAGSDSESDDDEEEQDEELEEESEDDVVEADSANEDEEMSDDGSTVSVPLDCFKNCDGPSDVVELESALLDSKHDNADDASVASEDSAMEELQDPTLQSALLCDIVELDPKPANPNALAHVKRVLSSSALLGRSSLSAPNPTMLSPKRICRADRGNDSSSGDDELPPELSLGQASYRANQRVSLSDEDDEEQDRQLGEELIEGEAERESVSTPIPLLTPPSSPLRVEGYEEDTTVCEWPSNLAVDSAMTATMDLRPPSPQDLQAWELEEEERLSKSEVSPKATPDQGSFSSSLTPMMRGISVEAEAPFLRL